MRAILAGFLVVVIAAIAWTWFSTIPACLASGWGTPGYISSPRADRDDQGLFGCWWARVTRERMREEAFKDWVRESERLDEEHAPRPLGVTCPRGRKSC